MQRIGNMLSLTISSLIHRATRQNYSVYICSAHSDMKEGYAYALAHFWRCMSCCLHCGSENLNTRCARGSLSSSTAQTMAPSMYASSRLCSVWSDLCCRSPLVHIYRNTSMTLQECRRPIYPHMAKY